MTWARSYIKLELMKMKIKFTPFPKPQKKAQAINRHLIIDKAWNRIPIQQQNSTHVSQMTV